MTENDQQIVQQTTQNAASWTREEAERVLGIHRIGVARAKRKLDQLLIEIQGQERVVEMREASIRAITEKRAERENLPAGSGER